MPCPLRCVGGRWPQEGLTYRSMEKWPTSRVSRSIFCLSWPAPAIRISPGSKAPRVVHASLPSCLLGGKLCLHHRPRSAGASVGQCDHGTNGKKGTAGPWGSRTILARVLGLAAARGGDGALVAGGGSAGHGGERAADRPGRGSIGAGDLDSGGIKSMELAERFGGYECSSEGVW